MVGLEAALAGARTHVADELTRHGIGDDACADVDLLVGQVIGDLDRHEHPTVVVVDVVVDEHRTVTVTITGGISEVPDQLVHPEPDAPTDTVEGRGLGALDALASSWGTRRRHLRTAVWFSVTDLSAPPRSQVRELFPDRNPELVPSNGDGTIAAATEADLNATPEVVALRARLSLTQQCRPEDLDRVRAAYLGSGIEAELSPFFTDMAQRLAEADFVIARAGASTVAELAIAGRPALLVPFPHAIDNHQLDNARAIDALVIEQSDFEGRPEVLAEKLRPRLESLDWLVIAAHAIAQHAIPDAASRLADLVESALTKEVTV